MKTKRWLSLLLCMLLCVGLMPTIAFAASGTPLTSTGGELTSGEYYLDQNIELVNNLTVPTGAVVTLDLNGCTLKGNGNGSVISVEGTLILEDTSELGNGMVTGGNAEYGGGIYVGTNGSVTMNGGKISENKASNRGGGVYIENRNGSFTLNDGEISYNTAPRGGGVEIDIYAEFKMNDGKISHNKGTTRAGGVSILTSAEMTMNGGEISYNEAKEAAGVYVLAGYFTMKKDTRISNNIATSNGGGIYTSNNASLYIYGGEVSENSADSFGGGIYAMSLSSNLTLQDVIIINNKAGIQGGGVYASKQAKMSGKIIIDRNTDTNENADNFFAVGTPSSKCILAGEIAEGSRIGYKTGSSYRPAVDDATQITKAETGTEYYKTAAQYFVSDEGYGIRASENGSYLEMYHVHQHSWETAWSYTETNHWHECTASGCTITDNSQKDGYAAHSYNREVVSDTYKASDANCTEPAKYYFSCVCGAKGTATFENGSANGHTWSSWEKSENDTHTRTCSICNGKETQNCSGGTATCMVPAVCEVCGQPYGEKNPNNHTGTEAWITTETTHTKVYSCCQAVIETETAHIWENGVCSECGYECQHSGGEATCANKAVCDICGEEYGEVNASNHTNLVKTEAKPATHMTEGNIEYWYCDGCKKYFSDEAGTKEITLADTVIPKLTGQTNESQMDESNTASTAVSNEEMQQNSMQMDRKTSVKATGKSLKVRWKKVDGADGYDIYAALCGDKFEGVVKSVDGDAKSVTIKKIAGKTLKAKQSYKVKVKAYRMVDGKKVYIANGRTLHVVFGSNAEYTNAGKVRVNKKNYTLKEPNTSKIRTSIVKQDKTKKLLSKGHGAKLTYVSTDTAVAKVSKNGKITAKKKGRCTIYVYALNGKCAKIKVTVR